MVKVDIHKARQYYEAWKKNGGIIEGVSERNAKLIKEFLFDLEDGTNVCASNKKGARSAIRLNSYKSKLKVLIQRAEGKYKKIDIRKLEKKEFNSLCRELRNGEIKRQDGKEYKDASDYIKSFKAFWHWLVKIEQVKEDITIEADVSKKKPAWVYLNLEQYKQLADFCKPYYRLLLYLALDTGARPGELLNFRVNSFSEDFKQVEILEDVSKTFGRKFKIMMTSEMIKSFIQENNLKNDDLLFPVTLALTNRYLKRRAKNIFGEAISKAKGKYSEFTLTDTRHCSACYWLPRYPTQQGMMYKFGWKKADKIFYYSEFLGMVDTIKEEDMLIDVTKTELQQNNDNLKKEFELLKDSNSHEIEALKKIQEMQTDVIKKILANMPKSQLKDFRTLRNTAILDGAL